MNPEWVELAQSDAGREIAVALSPSMVSEIVLPAKLWNVIRATSGWFEIRP